MPRCYWTISSNPNSHKCFYSVCHHICFPSSGNSLSPNGFYSVYRRICFSEWHIVPQLCIQIKQSRVHSRKALYEWKQVEDSENRYGVFIGFCLLPPTGLVGFCLKPTHIQGSYNSLSSVFRLLLIEAITFPFHLQKSKYSLSISISPCSIFCNSRRLRNFLLSPSTLYGPTL